MPIPEPVRRSTEAQVRAFCERRVPANLHDQVRLETITQGNAITIVERRRPWQADFGPEWTSQPVARFRYHPRDSQWRLYWPDRHGRWHLYDDVTPSPDAGPLLEAVDRDPTGIFWG